MLAVTETHYRLLFFFEFPCKSPAEQSSDFTQCLTQTSDLEKLHYYKRVFIKTVFLLVLGIDTISQNYNSI